MAAISITGASQRQATPPATLLTGATGVLSWPSDQLRRSRGAGTDTGIFPHARGHCKRLCTQPLHDIFATNFCIERLHLH